MDQARLSGPLDAAPPAPADDDEEEEEDDEDDEEDEDEEAAPAASSVSIGISPAVTRAFLRFGALSLVLSPAADAGAPVVALLRFFPAASSAGTDADAGAGAGAGAGATGNAATATAAAGAITTAIPTAAPAAAAASTVTSIGNPDPEHTSLSWWYFNPAVVLKPLLQRSHL
jgi:hypothetical protein